MASNWSLLAAKAAVLRQQEIANSSETFFELQLKIKNVIGRQSRDLEGVKATNNVTIL